MTPTLDPRMSISDKWDLTYIVEIILKQAVRFLIHINICIRKSDPHLTKSYTLFMIRYQRILLERHFYDKILSY